MRYIICHECATAILNDDYSGLTDEPLVMAKQFAEDHGLLVHVGTGRPNGYWRCESCQYDNLGEVVLVEMVL